MTNTSNNKRKMKQRLSKRFVCACSIGFVALSFFLWLWCKPPVLQQQWMEMTYVDSGHYHHNVLKQLRGARSYLDFRLRQNARLDAPQHLALIMAIDETALIDDWVHRPRHANHNFAVAPVRAFYDYAKARGVAVFFVSARPISHNKQTSSYLKGAGYRNWDGLFLMTDKQKDIRKFKEKKRAQVEKMGYKIVINLGSNPLDLRGSHAELPVLLPAPYRMP